MWQAIRPSGKNLYYWQLGVLAVFLLVWQLVSRNQQYAFSLGEPVKVLGRVWSWFMPFGFGPSLLFPEGLPGNADIYSHLGTTLLETLLAFGIGTLLGLGCGLWLALAPTASAILEPYIKAANAMPRVILAPIFALWFGLGIWSKVALAVTLVFFIVFFNLETAVGCARVCRERRAWQDETKQRTLVRNEEQHRQDRRARCNRVHSAVT